MSVIERVRARNSAMYLKTCALLIPKELHVQEETNSPGFRRTRSRNAFAFWRNGPMISAPGRAKRGEIIEVTPATVQPRRLGPELVEEEEEEETGGERSFHAS